MHYVAKNGLWITLGQLTTLVITLGLSILFANLLPMHEYGLYKYIISFVGILGAFKLTGMANVVVQGASNGHDGILRNAIRETLMWGLLPLSMAIISAVYYILNNNAVLGTAIIVASILNILIGGYGLHGSYLNGKQNFKLSSKFSIATQVINAVTIVGTLLVTHNVFYIIVANFLSTALMVCIFSFATIYRIPKDHKSDDANIKLGKHLSIMNALAHIANHLDKILVFQRLGAVELAIYSFAIAVPEQIKGSYKNLFAIAVPKYATLSKPALRYSIIKKTTLLTFLTGGVVILYVLIAPLMFQLLFPKYLDSVFYSQVYISGLLMVPALLLLQTYFQVQHQTKALYMINVTGNIINLIMTVVLIYFLGLFGAILLSITSKSTTLGLSLWYFYRDSN